MSAGDAREGASRTSRIGYELVLTPPWISPRQAPSSVPCDSISCLNRSRSPRTRRRSIRDLRIAEATRFDVTIKDGKVDEYRVRLGISFKYESGD